jgi:hypothetical protein
MTTLSSSSVISVTQDPSDAAARLFADIRAVASGANPQADADALASRPGILRRLSARLAEHLPAGTDRIVARAGADAQLATALSLHSGVPVALLEADGTVHGELYPSERVMVVAFFDSCTVEPVRSRLALLGCSVAGILTVITRPLTEGDGSAPVSWQPISSEDGTLISLFAAKLHAGGPENYDA